MGGDKKIRAAKMHKHCKSHRCINIWNFHLLKLPTKLILIDCCGTFIREQEHRNLKHR